MNCKGIYDELRKARTSGEFDRMVNYFCEVLRLELTNMGFRFEEHPDKGILGGQIANPMEYSIIGVYGDLNALRLHNKNRHYGNYLSEKNFSDLIKFKNQLPNI